MCCAPNILHILLTAQLATEKNLVPEGLIKHKKSIFSIQKVLTELRVQPVWPQLSRGRSRKRQWVMGLALMEGDPCLEYQHIFSVSLIVTVCAFIRFSVCFLSYGTRWLPCIMHWIMARLEVFVMYNSKRAGPRWTHSIWCTLHMDGTTAGIYIYMQSEDWSIFSSCRLSGKWLSYLQHKY